jgi:hypothetical protein
MLIPIMYLEKGSREMSPPSNDVSILHDDNNAPDGQCALRAKAIEYDLHNEIEMK